MSLLLLGSCSPEEVPRGGSNKPEHDVARTTVVRSIEEGLVHTLAELQIVNSWNLLVTHIQCQNYCLTIAWNNSWPCATCHHRFEFQNARRQQAASIAQALVHVDRNADWQGSHRIKSMYRRQLASSEIGVLLGHKARTVPPLLAFL